MAVVARTVIGGVLRATWDDATEQYTEFGTNGTTVTLSRSYTPVEQALKAQRVSEATSAANYTAIRSQIAAGIAALQGDIAMLNAGIALTDAQSAAQIGPNFKALCGVTKRLEDAVIGLARIVSGTLT